MDTYIGELVMLKVKNDYFTRAVAIMDVIKNNPEIVREDLILEVKKRINENQRVIRQTVREMIEDNFITEVERGDRRDNALDKRRAKGLIIKSRKRYKALKEATSAMV